MIGITETATQLIFSGDKRELTILAEHFRYHPDRYFMSDAYQLFKRSDGKYGWDGFKYPLKIKFTDGKMDARMGRGYLDAVLSVAHTKGIEVDKSKLLKRPFVNLQAHELPSDLVKADFELNEGQKICVTNWLKSVMGVNAMTVNAGKTVTFAAAVSFIKRHYPKARVLYCTPSERLVNQVSTELKKFLPDMDIGQYGGRKKEKDARDIVVSTTSMLSRNFDTLLTDGWFRTFMVLLIDESHHAVSPSMEKIIMAVKAFFRFGASATLKEETEDALTKIHALLGPILSHRIEDKELIDAGRSAKPILYVVDYESWHDKFSGMEHIARFDTPCWCLVEGEWKKGTYRGPAWEPDPDEIDGIKLDKKGNPIPVPNVHRITLDENPEEDVELESRWCLLHRRYDKAIIQFTERNKVIATWAKWYSDQGMPTLVICTRTLHVLILQSLIAEQIGDDMVRVLYSEHQTKERDETFEWLRRTPGAVLISPLAKEGVSINELQAGIIADHVVDWEVCKQMIGRFVRKKVKGVENVAHITVIVDRQHETMRRNSSNLLGDLEKIRGFQFHYPVTTPDSIPKAKVFATG